MEAHESWTPKTTCNKVGRSEDPFYPLPDITIVDRVYLKSPANTFPIIKSSTTSRYFTLPSLLRIQSYQMTYTIGWRGIPAFSCESWEWRMC